MFRVSLIALLLLLVSCVPKVDPVEPNEPDPLPIPVGDHAITGLWAGGLFSDAAFDVRVILSLEGKGNEVTGIVTFPEEPVPTGGQVTGTAGDSIELRIVVTDGIETLTLDLFGSLKEDDEFSGVFVGLLGTSGTFLFRRLQ